MKALFLWEVKGSTSNNLPQQIACDVFEWLSCLHGRGWAWKENQQEHILDPCCRFEIILANWALWCLYCWSNVHPTWKLSSCLCAKTKRTLSAEVASCMNVMCCWPVKNEESWPSESWKSCKLCPDLMASPPARWVLQQNLRSQQLSCSEQTNNLMMSIHCGPVKGWLPHAALKSVWLHDAIFYLNLLVIKISNSLLFGDSIQQWSGATPGSALRRNHSCQVPGNHISAGDWTWVLCIQGKSPPHCAIALAPQLSLLWCICC